MRIQNIILIIFISFSQLFAVTWGHLPPEVHKCKSTQNDECIAKAIEEVLKLYPNGNPAFNMPNISALNTTHIKISRSEDNSPIEINFEFIKCNVYGLEKLKILRVSGFDKELKKIEVDVDVPNLTMKGDYEVSGKLLLLPLNGKGLGELVLKNNTFKIRAKMQKEKRDNNTYLKIQKLKATLNPKRLIVNFENILNGNPVLSETINNVINENWKDIWKELQEGINHAMEVILEQLIKQIFEIITLEDMYTD